MPAYQEIADEITSYARSGGGLSSVRMERSNLTPAGFGQTNIPAAGIAPARNLPTTRQGGLSPVDKPVRPIGMAAPQASPRQLSVTGKAPTVAATYVNNYNKGLRPASASSGGEQLIKRDVTGLICH
jgi:hypothetical protein